MIRPSICLCMIVRDAAAFITETLACAAPHIDTWVIVDTGSVDDTPAVVEGFFAERGVAGELTHRPWVGFAHNRTEALALARGRADYLLVLDADDLISGEPPLEHLTADSYRFKFGPDFVYWRTALFRGDLRWEYRGVVHEYAVCLDDGATTENLEGAYHLVHRSLGGRGWKPETYERDAELLHQAWDDDPSDPRTAFYLGQSYRDAGRLDEAIKWYEHRVTMGGWAEEQFVAALEAARCKDRRGDPGNEVDTAYWAAWALRPSRAEPLHALAARARAERRWADGYLAASRGAAIGQPVDDLLFVNADVHRWRLIDEQAVCGSYLGLHEEAVVLNDRLLASPHVPLGARDRIARNRALSLRALGTHRFGFRGDLVDAVADRTHRTTGVTLTITTCRRRRLFERTIDSFLACCTDHLDIERWICIDDGSDDDDRAAMAAKYPFFEFIWKRSDEQGHASSMNRLLQEVDTAYWLHLEDDWEFVSRAPLVAQLRGVLDHDERLAQVVVNTNYAETLDGLDLVGGTLERTTDGLTFRRHQHLVPGTEEYAALFADRPHAMSSAYWPGFSLMPSMMRTSAIRSVGAFDPATGHFERQMADRIHTAGWGTAFLDTITCLTTGPLRNDHSARRAPNAYDLSGRAQFEAYPEITVGLVPNWTDGDRLATLWRRQFPAGGTWRGVKFVGHGDSTRPPDYWLVVNHPGPHAAPPPERTIVAHMEPAEGVAKWRDWSTPDRSKFLQVRDHATALNLLEWHLDMSYDELWSKQIVKSRDLSAVVSGTRWSPGHRLHLDLLHELEQHGVEIDVFGVDDIDGFASHLGPLPPFDKRNGLLPYRYTIAAENHAEPNYVTEKLVDAVLAECLCFYWGCPNLEEFLDPDAFIRLPTDDVGRSRELIVRAIADGEHERRLPAIREAKRQILDRLQLAPAISRAVRGAQLAERLEVRVINLDRRPDRWEQFVARIQTAAGESLANRCRRWPAIEAHEIEVTDDLQRVFRGGPLKRTEVACALSHLSLWWDCATGDGSPMLVFEDDVEPGLGFTGRLAEVCGILTEPGSLADVLFLGLSRWDDAAAPAASVQQIRELSLDGVMGGAWAYIVTQAGARQLWEIAQRDGIPCGIDTFVLRQAGVLRLREAVPALASSPIAWPDGPRIDSDIQYEGAMFGG